MVEICPKCGLPVDLCMCDEIGKESQNVVITDERGKYGKLSIVIQGLDPKNVDLKDLAKKLKQKLACGGTAKDGIIKLQYKFKEDVKKYLISQGFPEESIIIKR